MAKFKNSLYKYFPCYNVSVRKRVEIIKDIGLEAFKRNGITLYVK